jgi:CSLREA domain-containing protein
MRMKMQLTTIALVLALVGSPCVSLGQKPPAVNKRSLSRNKSIVPSVTRVVTKTADTNDGVCGVDCSLREAVGAANDGDSITFSALFNSPQTIFMKGELPIQADVSIIGTGANLITLSGGGANRVINIGFGANVTLSGLTIADGMVNGLFGGGIHNDGTLNVTDCVISGNTVNSAIGNASGGGIFNEGAATLTVTNSTFSGNTAGGVTGSGLGGGIYNFGGILNVTNCVFSGNTATGAVSGEGGGIYNYNNTATISGTNISGNMASSSAGFSFGGGIINNVGTLIVTNTTITNNTVTASNADEGDGGAVYNLDGTATFTNSSFSGNMASGGFGLGGGLHNDGGTLTVNSSTISGNTATGNINQGHGGGIFNSGTTNVANSTVSGNTATGIGAGIGGGLYTDNGGGFTLNVTNCTISNNTAAGTGAGTGGGIRNGPGSVMNIKNTIVAGNNVTGAATLGPDVRLAFTSQGYNLIGKTDGSTGFTFLTDLTGTIAAPLNAMLGPLGNYGGPTQTHQLLAGSPAIDKGAAVTPLAALAVLTTDQRGAPRPFDNPSIPNAAGGDGSDIGGFEVQAPTAALVSVTGRVLTGSGGLSNAIVVLTDAVGNTRTTTTGSFGYYRFDNLAAGQTVVVSVVSKRFQFTPQVVSVNDNIADLNFVPSPL